MITKQAAILMTLISVLVVDRAGAVTWDRNRDGSNPDTDAYQSYVRDGDHAAGFNIVSLDDAYAADAAAAGWGSVDVLMQICWGGGFANNFDSAFGTSDYTFASAARHDGLAWNVDTVGAASEEVDNFARAWRNSAETYTTAGMFEHYINATYGAQGDDGTSDSGASIVAKSPFTRPSDQGLGLQEELPQYGSPDSTASGSNDSRTLGDITHAVLVQWDSLENERHTLNIQRMVDMLTNSYGLASTNIVVLTDTDGYDDGTSTVNLINSTSMQIPARASAIAPDTGAMAAVGIDGANSAATWGGAIDGSLFGITPSSSDRLFVFNTGDGATQDALSMLLNTNNASDCAGGSGSCRTWSAPLSHYPRDFVSLPDHHPISTNLTGDDETISLNLAFKDMLVIPLGTRLFINGRDLGPIDLLEDDVSPLRFHPFVPDGGGGAEIDVYEVEIPLDLINHPDDLLLNPALLTIELSKGPGGLLPVDQQHLRAIAVRGGDQEFMIVNLPPPPPPGTFPEPATGMLLAIAVAVVGMRRRGA